MVLESRISRKAGLGACNLCVYVCVYVGAGLPRLCDIHAHVRRTENGRAPHVSRILHVCNNRSPLSLMADKPRNTSLLDPTHQTS